MDYIRDCLENHKLQSSYYVSEIPTIYFLSRWYDGEALKALQANVTVQLKRYAKLNGLMLSLLISSAYHLKLKSVALDKAVGRLQTLSNNGHWAANGLYIDPAIQGVPHYAGSEALTTAFALEALINYQKLKTIKPHAPKAIESILQKSLLKIELTLPSSNLRVNYRGFVNNLLSHDSDQQISGIATLTARAYGHRIPTMSLNALNLASLHGWIAYTIYDDIWDGAPKPELLGVANVALRQTHDQFRLAIPDSIDFQLMVSKTLNQVDSANTWEYTHARANVNNDQVTIIGLPDYEDLQQLADRSWGHCLAATGVMLLAKYPLGSPEQKSLQRFFRYFLIARQLNDDAHDWEDDLRNGQLSAVVCMLLRSYGKPAGNIKVKQEIKMLRMLFWEQIIDQVVDVILISCKSARQALELCPFKHPEIYEAWLTKLEAAAKLALSEREETENFIASYSTNLH
jgi:hypothetical protein